MDINAAKQSVRDFLRAANKSQVARETGISLSWIQKFSHGHFDNPTSERLAFLLAYISKPEQSNTQGVVNGP